MPPMALRLLPIVVLFFAASPWAAAEYYHGDFTEIPVERLIENLERKLEAEPDNAQAHYLLARVHTMAFASGRNHARVNPDTGAPRFDDGASGTFIPPRGAAPVSNGQAETGKERREHLEVAICHYRRALELDPDHLPSQVGLGWSLLKAEKREKALQVLRPAFERAWEKEKDAFGVEAGRSLSMELGRYLLQLLDPSEDSREIVRIHRKMQVIEAKPKWMTPILIPLGDRTDLASLTTSTPTVEFDLDGSEAPRRWQWITPAAGWLVHDPLGRGDITSGRQLIGGVTFWIYWNDGYEALSALDDNADGELRDLELRGLAIWRDVNMNGASEPGEVRPVGDWGVTALACESEAVSSTVLMSRKGVQFEDGAVRPSYDWIPMGQPIEASD